MADPLPMLPMFDKQIQLRMGQANVWRWVPEILPLLTDDDPLGVDDFATHHLPLEHPPRTPRSRPGGRHDQDTPAARGEHVRPRGRGATTVTATERLGPHLNGQSEHLTVLLEFETLAMGIDGELALGEALMAVVPAHPRLGELDLAGRGRVEEIHLDAVRQPFAVAE